MQLLFTMLPVKATLLLPCTGSQMMLMKSQSRQDFDSHVTTLFTLLDLSGPSTSQETSGTVLLFGHMHHWF